MILSESILPVGQHATVLTQTATTLHKMIVKAAAKMLQSMMEKWGLSLVHQHLVSLNHSVVITYPKHCNSHHYIMHVL